MEEQKHLKNARTAKICGILSIIIGLVGSCCCIGYISSPLSIVAIILGALSKNEVTNELYPDAKLGLICGIIGIGVGTFGSFIMYFVFAFFGVASELYL